MDGAIETWNLDNGNGVIRGVDGKIYLADFRDFEEFKARRIRISLEAGQDVSFAPAGNRAECITYDSRPAIFRFAWFHNYPKTIAELANHDHAVAEKWSSRDFDEDDLFEKTANKAAEQNWFAEQQEKQFLKNRQRNDFLANQAVEEQIRKVVTRKKYEILFSFFERTFQRLELEKKIVYSETGAAFNTGLGNKFNKDIYAIFKATKNEFGNPYEFEKFSDENYVGITFDKLPEPADYFCNFDTNERVPSDNLLLDSRKPIFSDDKHLFDDRRNRFPESWSKFDNLECSATFQTLLDVTKRRVRRNFRAAVPFYYPGVRKIQMLLPVTFYPGTDQQEIRALVVARKGAGYSVETIMPLDWAYKNARLIAKPDRDDWLDF